jgi:hypothetical protein
LRELQSAKYGISGMFNAGTREIDSGRKCYAKRPRRDSPAGNFGSIGGIIATGNYPRHWWSVAGMRRIHFRKTAGSSVLIFVKCTQGNIVFQAVQNTLIFSAKPSEAFLANFRPFMSTFLISSTNGPVRMCTEEPGARGES